MKWQVADDEEGTWFGIVRAARDGVLDVDYRYQPDSEGFLQFFYDSDG